MTIHWQPTATIEALKERAKILARIRAFFARKDVLEVDTPLLASAGTTDVHLANITANIHQKTYYLQTSPEYAMKRLLCAGSGSIYQMGKAFRLDETGTIHNLEFTMLEWYRLNMDHHALMDEVDELLQLILKCKKAERYTYQELFEKYLKFNPLTATLEELLTAARETGFTGELDRDGWLQLLMSHLIEPKLGATEPVFVYDFPASQAALAKVRGNVASRFEIYYHGIELGNGFHELQDAKEQRARFEKDLAEREKRGLSQVPLDEHFLKALEHGLPNCSGVAVGVDRLIMLALKASRIEEVLSFKFEE